MRKIFGDIEEIHDEVETGYNSFKNFEVVHKTPSDHHYSTQTHNRLMKFTNRQEFRKKMEEEWRALEEHIPSSIFVRVFKHRIDLMRAAFLGPRGSDYQHCLFFFDIFFPENYPDVPPMIQYLCYDDKHSILSPNIQPGGRVCLDIMETWYGPVKWNWSCMSSREKSRTKEFDALSVLDAIQDMVSRNSAQPSRSSSNVTSGPSDKRKVMIFSSACENMIRVMKKPPIGFEFLVGGHFRRRSHQVLLTFKGNEFSDKIKVDLFNRMVRVFEENGSYCKHHMDFLESRKQIAIGEVTQENITIEEVVDQ